MGLGSNFRTVQGCDRYFNSPGRINSIWGRTPHLTATNSVAKQFLRPGLPRKTGITDRRIHYHQVFWASIRSDSIALLDVDLGLPRLNVVPKLNPLIEHSSLFNVT